MARDVPLFIPIREQYLLYFSEMGAVFEGTYPFIDHRGHVCGYLIAFGYNCGHLGVNLHIGRYFYLSCGSDSVTE